MFEKEITKNEIPFEKQYIIKEYGHTYDFYIPSLNLLVELDGDYWHGNKPENKLKDFQKKTQKRDIRNTDDAINLNYKIIRFWGSVFTKLTKECFEEIIEYGKTGIYRTIGNRRCL